MAISGLGYFAIETSEAEKWHELLTAVLGMGFERASGVKVTKRGRREFLKICILQGCRSIRSWGII